MLLRKGTFLIVLMIAVFFQSCFRMRTSDRKTKRLFDNKKLGVRILKLKLKAVNYPIRVVGSEYDSSKENALFFIHGAPGASDNYYTYLQDSLLITKANLYAIDRPGYGFSNFGKAEISITKQAEVVAEIIDSLPEKNIIVLGHSFGGPIAAYSSLLSPKIKSVLMLAPAIDPENEKVFWVANFAKWKLTKWMIPGALGISGDEKFTHVEELSKIKDSWKNVNVPVIHIHGTKDIIVPFENINFSEKAFKKEYIDTIVLEKENHFLPWKRYQLVKSELLKMIDSL